MTIQTCGECGEAFARLDKLSMHIYAQHRALYDAFIKEHYGKRSSK